MKDPFQASARWQQFKFVLWMLVLLVSLLALSVLLDPNKGGGEEETKAEVLRFGSHPTSTGDHPIVTVRLADGSIRQIYTSRQAARGCKKGSHISVVQRGGFLSVGIRGCYPPA